MRSSDSDNNNKVFSLGYYQTTTTEDNSMTQPIKAYVDVQIAIVKIIYSTIMQDSPH